jgi:hypothetical protein
MSKENNNPLNLAATEQYGKKTMATFNVNNKSIEVSEKEIMSIINKCMKNVMEDNTENRRQRKISKMRQAKIDFCNLEEQAKHGLFIPA